MSRRLAGVAVNTGTNAAESNASTAVLDGDMEAPLVAAGEQGLAGRLVLEDGADGVDDVLGGQFVSPGDDGVARLAAVGVAGDALVDEAAAGGGVDCAVDAAAAAEGVFRGVDDGVDGEGGDVCAEEGDAGVEGGGGWAEGWGC